MRSECCEREAKTISSLESSTHTHMLRTKRNTHTERHPEGRRRERDAENREVEAVVRGRLSPRTERCVQANVCAKEGGQRDGLHSVLFWVVK